MAKYQPGVTKWPANVASCQLTAVSAINVEENNEYIEIKRHQ